MKWAFLFVLFLFATGCTTAQKKETPKAEWTPVKEESESSRIDLQALQNALKMSRERESLGFNEKTFDTCKAGYGYASSQNCHQEHFVVIHFRLLCRDSEGTISTILSDEDLRPLDRRDIRWNLNGVQGTLRTDGQGYGQIVTASVKSQKNQRIKLALGNEFLYMKANEIKKVITPLPWCDQY